MHLGPVAFQENTDAADTHNVAVADRILNGSRRLCRSAHVRLHDKSADNGKHCPAYDGQHHTGSCRSIRFLVFSARIIFCHQSIYAYAGSHRNGGNDKLDGEDNGKRRQTVPRIFTHKETVYYIIKRLNKQRQHDRRCNLKQNLPDIRIIKNLCIIGFCFHP